MDESRLELYDNFGNKATLKSFAAGDVVIARVAKRMTEKEFRAFIDSNRELQRIFERRLITLIFIPDWIEFKDWKEA